MIMVNIVNDKPITDKKNNFFNFTKSSKNILVFKIVIFLICVFVIIYLNNISTSSKYGNYDEVKAQYPESFN